MFAILPTIIFYTITFGVFPAAVEELVTLGQVGADNFSSVDISNISAGYFIFSFFSGIVLFILSFLMSLTFYYFSIYKKGKMNLKQAVNGGLNYFWAFLGLGIVVSLALLGLFILLIIPGIIFMIYWIFSGFVLMKEKTGIIDSMKRSKAIVKGNWWKVFGFFLLFCLIVIGISIVFSIPAKILDFTITGGASILPIETFNLTSYIISQTINYIFSVASSIIIVPLSILFFKNFYLDMKSRK